MRRGSDQSKKIEIQIENLLRSYPQFNDCTFSSSTLSMNIYFPGGLGSINLRIPSRRVMADEVRNFITLVSIGLDEEIRGQGITHILLDSLESIATDWNEISAVEVESVESPEMLRILKKRGYLNISGQSKINFYSSNSFIISDK